jgi:hypothetical protein
MTNSNDKAEYYAPTHMHRFVHHYHNLIYIKNYWESIGQIAPEWVQRELQRADREMQQLIEEEKAEGGFLHKREETTDEARTIRQKRY